MPFVHVVGVSGVVAGERVYSTFPFEALDIAAVYYFSSDRGGG